MSKKSNFTISERKFFLRIFDILAVVAGIVFAASFENFYYFNLESSQIFTWFLTLIIYLSIFSQIFEMYSLKVADDYFAIFRSIVVTAFLTTALYVFTPYISPELPLNRLQILYLFLAISSPLFLWRIIYIIFVFSPKYFKTILIIGNASEVKRVLNFVKSKATTNQVACCISSEDCEEMVMDCYDLATANIEEILEGKVISEIVVADYDTKKHKQVHTQLIHLFEQGEVIISAKKFKEREAAMMPEMSFNDPFYDVMTFSSNHQNRMYLVFLRIFDIVVSLIGVFFMSLMLPFFIIGNVLGNRGRLFYYQIRVGAKGERFEIIKLRTMVKNAEKNGAEWAKRNDVRVTKFGKFLRLTRLDEVPQFLNILKGEMSLIGPRPERPEFVWDLQNKLPFYAIRHVIKPGLTGWAQVMHPYASSIEDQELKLRYDLYYIKERNLLLDFKIIVKTITTVLFFRGQ
ncbi:exopolysaccharide biosynthesis polyprenyl glycosylphosphotransferase [Urechidicola vernalis]|uniref:Exopolysaccharide biosynthesis polyprenyl glycosylphosphotransferase n=1 Tax=Urechidicola vernalis TaxID=3075600 RepID=A0ABU2Y388_9FLAO|nr:exopolysaccharide biosynthesis polyprenyl glycosylphosphotransferase [Urechidicola sp. P050]MDT0552255.1 exopolysaccharide biosynthesis polyprenyl glycosylphosphotransferase [Urechidicola sp. P050]